MGSHYVGSSELGFTFVYFWKVAVGAFQSSPSCSLSNGNLYFRPKNLESFLLIGGRKNHPPIRDEKTFYEGVIGRCSGPTIGNRYLAFIRLYLKLLTRSTTRKYLVQHTIS